MSPDRAGNEAVSHGEELESLLDYLRESRGFDFSVYKRTSLERCISKRLASLELDSYTAYRDHLEVDPDEFTRLFDGILINVTGFFRDEAAWRYLAESVLASLIDSVPQERPIRVWSAACASGEEAYTIAMLLAEALGEEAFLERVKIYATDIDEDALAHARLGTYPLDAAKAIPEDLLDRYWQANGKEISFRPDLRRCVIFGRNDLVQDAPISRVDLLISRNALMYFIPEAQARILSNFNFSLNPDGFLFLGKAEMLLTFGGLFKPHNLRYRVFSKVPKSGMRGRLTFPLEPGAERYARVREGAVDTSPVAQLAFDGEGLLAFANESARLLFGLVTGDLGRPIQDLEVSYRPLEMRQAIADATRHFRRMHLGRVEFARAGSKRILDVEVAPLQANGAVIGVAVSFVDLTELVDLGDRLEESKRQLGSAYDELQSTVEELETTNEELQSTNEELETTNEELQSTNEELETMNEELQSTNDELETLNEQQRERSDEVDRLNLFLEGILASLGLAVIVLDAEQTVHVWNNSATELWGLRSDEVEGKHFLTLDMGLPVESVRAAIRRALAPEDSAPSTLTIDAVNRRGKAFECLVRVLPLLGEREAPYGAILLMSDAGEQASDDGARSVGATSTGEEPSG